MAQKAAIQISSARLAQRPKGNVYHKHLQKTTFHPNSDTKWAHNKTATTFLLSQLLNQFQM